MRVAVVGLGGVGGYIAASFAKSGIDVIGFARGEHLKTIQTQGIKIVEDENCWDVDLDARALDDLDGYFEGSFDVVIFCVKSYDLVDSYEHIRSHIDDKTILISFSNGVSNGETLRDLTNSTVLDGCVYILSHIENPGTIRKKGKVFAAVFGGEENGGLIFPEMQYCRDSAMAIAKILEIMANENKTLSELIKEVPIYEVFKTKMPCPNDKKEKVMKGHIFLANLF